MMMRNLPMTPQPLPPFRERLATGRPLLADGAMGTLLQQRADVSIRTCFELFNLERPDLVRGVHEDYLRAGADIIETNTFGANRLRLTDAGLAEQVEALNRAGVALARQAIANTGRAAYVAGAVGPLGAALRPYGPISQEQAESAFCEQLGILVEEGVDLLIFETFINHDELLLALGVARQLAPDLPLVAQATFNSDRQTYAGYPPARVANDLHKAGATVIGVNCGLGPMQLAQIVADMHRAVPQARLSAMPNAGHPEAIGGRIMYTASPAYFADFVPSLCEHGARIIGGCCGTTPEHVAALRAALDAQAETQPVAVQVAEQTVPPPQPPSSSLPPTHLARRLAEGQFTITVEVAPPRSYTAETMLGHARLLRDAGADLLDVSDTPAAKMKMSAWAAAYLIQQQVGVETVLHFPTRGRNLLRVQGDLLAAHALGLRNLFVTMGDPVKIGDYPAANDHSDIAPSKLIDLVAHSMNAGQDMAGNSIGAPTAFTVGCALNMAADDLDNELRVLGNKLAAGAHFALGQMVFDPPRVETFLKKYREVFAEDFKLPVLMGVMPLYSVKHARFLHNEVPGITIPDALFARIEAAGDDAPREGVQIAIELMRAMRPYVQGAYIIPSYGRYRLAAEVVDAIVNAPVGA